FPLLLVRAVPQPGHAQWKSLAGGARSRHHQGLSVRPDDVLPARPIQMGTVLGDAIGYRNCNLAAPAGGPIAPFAVRPWRAGDLDSGLRGSSRSRNLSVVDVAGRFVR